MVGKKYRRRLDSLLEGIQIIGFDWTYRYLNDIMAEHARMSKEDLLGKKMTDVYQGFAETHAYCLIEDCMLNRTSHRLENHFTYPDGEQRWFDLSISPDEEGVRILSLDITPYKESQKKYLASENRFRAMVEKSLDLKALADAEGYFTYVSPSITPTLGYLPQEMIGRHVSEFVYPADLPRVTLIRSTLLEKPGETISYQFRVLHKSGEFKWCEANSSNLLDEPGVEAVVTNFIDITKIKQAEQEREFEKNKLDALINNSNDLMWSIDTEFRLLTSNQPFDNAVIAHTGKTLKKGDSVFDLPDDYLAKWFRESYLRAFKGEKFSEIYSSETEKMWLEVSFHPIWKRNEVVGSACHAHDITRTKILEEELKNSVRQLQDYKYALDVSSIVAITDHHGKITYVNDNFCDISGYNREELIGEDHRILNSGYHSKKFFRDLWRTISSGKVWRGEIRNISKTGEYYWVDTSIIPFLDEYEKPYQYVAIRTDITARKEAEEELIRNITALKKTNFELDRFAYSVSHDLRAPLASILGLVSFIEEDTQEPETAEHAKMIRSGIVRLDDFIKNILSYSRKNRREIEIERVSVTEKAKEIINAVANAKNANDINFEIDIDEQDAFFTDVHSLSVVLQNLISNAIKFHKEDEKHRYIRVKGCVDNSRLSLVVEDNGIGIPEEHQQRIFDMFFRLSGKVEGSGIGLYITKEIVEKLDGKIKVESDEGKGSRFILELKNLKP